jgi:hypothetical protein
VLFRFLGDNKRCSSAVAAAARFRDDDDDDPLAHIVYDVVVDGWWIHSSIHLLAHFPE